MTMAVDTKGAAERIGLASKTLENMRTRGDGPQFMKLGRAVRYRIADLDAWMAARLVSSTSERAAA